jgi:hypothetical protein
LRRFWRRGDRRGDHGEQRVRDDRDLRSEHRWPADRVGERLTERVGEQ